MFLSVHLLIQSRSKKSRDERQNIIECYIIKQLSGIPSIKRCYIDKKVSLYGSAASNEEQSSANKPAVNRSSIARQPLFMFLD